jgi:tRNA dimethylallyltransferase
VALVGATATGKTAAALALARRFDGEVVSADSRQIYRGMTIGTAAPTAAERAAVPHHLLAIRDPDEPFSLADYLGLARATIDGIHGRGRLPLVVGGTAQYVVALLEGWQAPPVPPDPALRARLEAEGAPALHARLLAVDPAAAERIGPRNTRRLARALEVWTLTGRPISAWQADRAPTYPALTLGLRLDRPTLHARIAARVDAMLAGGLVAEVEALLAADYQPDLPSFSSVGYREIAAFLRGEVTLAEARQRTIQATNRYVRHQEIWLRHLPNVVWADGADPAAAVARLTAVLAAFLANGSG